MNEAREQLRELILKGVCPMSGEITYTVDELAVLILTAIKEGKVEGVGVCEGCEKARNFAPMRDYSDEGKEQG